jgi:hypothetical protein
MLTEKRKQQIQDWLVALGIALFIVVVPTAIALVVAAREEEWQTIYCVTTDTLMTCISRQPCNTYARTQKGELTLRKAEVNWPDGMAL